MPLRTIAVDWSGAVSGAEKKIWLAEAADGVLVRLESGRDRTALAAQLIEDAARTPELVVGLDFAFAMPAWFPASLGIETAPELWARAAREGESWLAACEPPFWGRPGRKRPAIAQEFRATDRAIPAISGIRPKSVFQIGGAGAVGTGSLRGMPTLLRLREAGFAIWPFDAATYPCAIEIYPRLLTGAVVKGSADARGAYLTAHCPNLSKAFRALAAASEDAFDAAISALAMDAARASLAALPAVTDPVRRIEGEIWVPPGTRAAAP